MVIRKNSWLFVAVGTYILGASGAALAATGANEEVTTSQQKGAAENVSSTASLNEVVVTARRRAENLQKVPESVSVLGGDYFQSHEISTALDLEQSVPTLNVNSGNSRDVDRFSMRGQGQITYGDPGVVAYFAGVPLASGGAGSGYYFDLANIQVLAGPQGTLFGRNTTGGAVLIEPAAPVAKFGGYASLDIGNYHNVDAQGAINLPFLNDKLLVRVSGEKRTREGYTHDVNTGRDYDNINFSAGRISMLFRPTDDVQNSLIAYTIRSNNNGTGFILTNVNSAETATRDFPQLPSLVAQQDARGPRLTSYDGPSKFEIKSWAAVDRFQWDLSRDLEFKNIVSYQTFQSMNLYDLDGTTLPILEGIDTGTWNNTGNPMDREVVTEEPQLSGAPLGGQLHWIAGIFYEHDIDNPFVGYAVNLLPVPGNTRAYNFAPVGQDLRSSSAYAQATYDLSQLARALSGVRFTAGYRYTHDWKERWNGLQFPDAQLCSAPLAYPNCIDRASAVFSKGTYTLTLDDQITRAVLVYVTRRTGFKSGFFNLGIAAALANVIPRAVNPELVTDDEVGLKSQFAVGNVKVRFNMDAYDDAYDNMQRTTLFTVPGTTLLGFGTANAASATIKGVEFETTVIPAEDLELSLNGALMDAKYDQFVNPVVGNVAGQLMPFSPKTSLDASATYWLPMRESVGDVGLTLDESYLSSVRQSDDHVPGNIVSGYGLLNGKIDWKSVWGGPLEVMFYVDNALNRVYKNNVSVYYNTAYGFNSASYGPPRMYGVKLTYEF